MSMTCGRPQEGEGGQSHVDAYVRQGGQKPHCLVVIINGWPLGQDGTAFQ